jgi:hypothetical protein
MVENRRSNQRRQESEGPNSAKPSRIRARAQSDRWQYHAWEIAWTPRVLGLFSKLPIPVESRLALALPRLRECEVVPFIELKAHDVSLWVRNAFVEAGHCKIRDGDAASIRSCNEVRRFVDEAVEQHAVAVGHVWPVFTFPLGRWLMRSVPLVDGKWIDEQVLELIIYSQILEQNGLVRLPPIDPNPGAFERVFPKETSWPLDSGPDAAQAVRDLPSEVGEKQLSTLREEACRHVQHFKLAPQLIHGLPHLSIEDLKAIDDGFLIQTIQLHKTDESNTGVVVEDWNRWVRDESPNVKCKGIEVALGELGHSGTFPDRYDVVAVDDPEKLRELLSARREVIQSLLLDCRNHYRESLFTEVGILDAQPGEKKIVMSLYRKAMIAEDLAAVLNCDRRTVFKWLKRIGPKGERIVLNDSDIGGFYLPSFPPP